MSYYYSPILAVAVVFFLSSSGRSDSAPEDSLVGKHAGEVWDNNDLKLKLVWCPPGKFTMGSPKEEPGRDDHESQVATTLTKGFWLGQTEVTKDQWKSVMETEPWKENSFVKEGANYPATHVSWKDAIAFCRKLTVSERRAGRLPAGWEYALPTEAQWEYACRAGTTTRYSFGDDESKLGEYAWFSKNASDVGEKYAHEVGLKLANPWGLYDVHGNAYEWCRDEYDAKLPGGSDPEVTESFGYRVFRGGDWNFAAKNCRSAYRFGVGPGLRSSYHGFRLALVPVAP